MACEILIEKRSRIDKYAPYIVHVSAHKIAKCLSLVERNYWWKINYNLFSTKTSEIKFKRYENGKLELPTCHVCKTNGETKNHYDNECATSMRFRK